LEFLQICPSFRKVLNDCNNDLAWYSYYALYFMTLAGTLSVGLRELLQAVFSWKTYARSRENLLEFLIVTGTLAYLVVPFFKKECLSNFFSSRYTQ
jgi:hypothetical protein